MRLSRLPADSELQLVRREPISEGARRTEGESSSRIRLVRETRGGSKSSADSAMVPAWLYRDEAPVTAVSCLVSSVRERVEICLTGTGASGEASAAARVSSLSEFRRMCGGRAWPSPGDESESGDDMVREWGNFVVDSKREARGEEDEKAWRLSNPVGLRGANGAAEAAAEVVVNGW